MRTSVGDVVLPREDYVGLARQIAERDKIGIVDALNALPGHMIEQNDDATFRLIDEPEGLSIDA